LVQEPHLLFAGFEWEYIHALADRAFCHDVLPAVLDELRPLIWVGYVISVFELVFEFSLFGRGYREQSVLVRRRFPLLNRYRLAEHIHESRTAFGVLL